MNIKALPLPSIETLNSALSYDHIAGSFTWNKRNEMRSQWNITWAGRPAGGVTVGREGKRYLHIPINNKKYKAHRIAWKMFYGVDPDGEIDHINGDSMDNRIVNLRLVTHQENCKNMRKKPRGKSSIHAGVTWIAKRDVWMAYIGHNMKKHFLGEHKDLFSAIAARKSAENSFGFHVNHGTTKTAGDADKDVSHA